MSKLARTVIMLGLAGAAVAVWLAALPAAQRSSPGCGSTGPSGAQSGSRPTHAYFETLIARPDCLAAYSLRDNSQLQRFAHGPKRIPHRVTYEPSRDSDPRRQDAAKITLPAGDQSLRKTVRLPIGTSDGTTTLVTWDAWFGKEFRFADTGIENYKTFQFASPAKRIWFEVRTRFRQADGAGRRVGRRDNGQGSGAGAKEPQPAPGSHAGRDRVDIGLVDARAYGGRGTSLGPNVETGGSLTPKVGSFMVRAETWTRYWVLIDQRANDWDLVSLWVADEDNDPVQIIDRRQLNVRGSVESFWLEYNTSSRPREGLKERVGYARNVVMLRNVADVANLLRRPVK